jgi:hypothetical protein
MKSTLVNTIVATFVVAAIVTAMVSTLIATSQSASAVSARCCAPGQIGDPNQNPGQTGLPAPGQLKKG